MWSELWSGVCLLLQDSHFWAMASIAITGLVVSICATREKSRPRGGAGSEFTKALERLVKGAKESAVTSVDTWLLGGVIVVLAVLEVTRLASIDQWHWPEMLEVFVVFLCFAVSSVNYTRIRSQLKCLADKGVDVKRLRVWTSSLVILNFVCLAIATCTVHLHDAHLASLATVYLGFCLHNMLTRWHLCSLGSADVRAEALIRRMLFESRAAFQGENAPAAAGYSVVMVGVGVAMAFAAEARGLMMYVTGAAGFHLALSSVSYFILIGPGDVAERVVFAAPASSGTSDGPPLSETAVSVLRERPDVISWWLVAGAWCSGITALICARAIFPPQM